MVRGSWRCALLGAVLGAMVMAPARGEEPERGAVTGRVTDPAGQPVPAARVGVRSQLTGRSRETWTDETGSYRLTAVPGRYWLGVAHRGFSEAGREIEIGGAPAQEDIRLSLAPVLEQVTVVSSSRVEELRDSSPTRVDVVTREEMRNTGYERVSDVLSEIPGVVTRRGSSAPVAGLQVQGIDSRQVLLLQDGLPIPGARGIKSGVLNLHRQSTGRLEQVEVVKGAASALYGSDAIGGVVNMISREPANPFEANVNVSGGSLSALDARGDVGARLDRWTVFLDAERHQQQAYSLLPDDPTTVSPKFSRNDLLFRARYRLSPRAALGVHANASHNHELGRTSSSATTSNDSVQNYALTGDFQPTAATALQVRAYSARYDENSLVASGGVLSPSNLNERYRRLDATLGHAWGSRQYLQLGTEWTQNQYRGANRLVGDNAGQQVTATDGWVQDRIQLLPRATLTLGGRYQRHSLFGGAFVPKAGLVARVAGPWSLRAGYGHGFRAPDLGQLFYRFANPASFYQVIGNPALRPEHSRSLSAGAVYARDRMRFGLSLYRNDVRDLIDSLLAGTPRTPAEVAALQQRFGIPDSFGLLTGRQTFVYQNLSRIYTRGIEVEGEISLRASLRLRGAYTYLDARDKQSGAPLTQRHKHQGFAAGEYLNRRWGLFANLRASFYGGYFLNAATRAAAYPYQIWDGYASRRLARGLTAYGAIDNLFNSRDRKLGLPGPTFDRPDYGRTFRIGFRYTFERERS